MTPDEAIKAIQIADTIYVHVLTSTNYEGNEHYSDAFRVPKEDAIKAMRDVGESGFVPNVEVSEDGKTVTIGKATVAPVAENFSHFENNNGNF
ncbi:MAG: hypothetical protein V4628_17780 [Pseudomonadota bacterium]